MPVRLIFSLLLWMAFGLPVLAQSQPLTVFAAASLKTALDDVVSQFQDQTGGTVQVSYAASSALARQIQYGAPADIFISANPDWMDVLQTEGLLVDETRVDLLSNQLVLIAGPGSDSQLKITPEFGLADALDQSWLAMALIDAVPAGIYGKAALQSLGVWDEVQPHVAQSENVRVALMLVAIGEAPLGIVYASDASADSRVRILDVFPADSHPPIVYPVAILQDSQNPDAVRFLSFLSDPTARRVFVENGFGLPLGAP